MAHNQQTIVIGGLRAQNLEDEVTRVPVLGDVPLLGRLFKTTRKDHQKQELVIFLTPTIVDEFTHPESSRLAQADEDISARMRHSQKSTFERWTEKLSGGSHEINVSIGQSGNIFSEGEMTTLGDLMAELTSVEKKAAKTVVLRSDPRAAKALVHEVTEQIELIGLKVKHLEVDTPFVPVTPEEVTP